MQIQVRFFAALREATGRPEQQLDVDPAATPDSVWARLVEQYPGLAQRRKGLSAAVNRRYVSFAQPLVAGDELVFIPPVSGG